MHATHLRQSSSHESFVGEPLRLRVVTAIKTARVMEPLKSLVGKRYIVRDTCWFVSVWH